MVRQVHSECEGRTRLVLGISPGLGQQSSHSSRCLPKWHIWATERRRAYLGLIDLGDVNTNINKLEAIIVVVVMSQSDGCSGTVVGTCQEPHAARMCWMVQAVLDVMITFESIEGVDKNLWWQMHSAGHTFPINRQRDA